MPLAERLLWSELRGRREDGLKFRRQHPVAPYILDFAECSLKFAIELDGVGHASASEIARDENRTLYLESKGWTVIRFENAYAQGNLSATVDAIIGTARALRAHPHQSGRFASSPLPPQAGEEPQEMPKL